MHQASQDYEARESSNASAIYLKEISYERPRRKIGLPRERTRNGRGDAVPLNLLIAFLGQRTKIFPSQTNLSCSISRTRYGRGL